MFLASETVYSQDDRGVQEDVMGQDGGSVTFPDDADFDSFHDGDAPELPVVEDRSGAGVVDPGAAGGDISAPSVMADTVGSDTFFDANDLVPQGEMARSGPVKVNPVTQPASKFITVTRNSGPNSKQARYVAIDRAVALGRYDSALQMIDDIYLENPRDKRAVFLRATTLQKLGRFDEAMSMYEELSKLDPDNLDLKINMLGLLGTRYPSIALRRLIELHQKHKGNAGVVAQLAVAYAQNGDADSAVSYLGVAASMEPRNASHVFNMAVILDRAGRASDAIAYYEKALEIDTINGGGKSIPRDSIYERLARIR